MDNYSVAINQVVSHLITRLQINKLKCCPGERSHGLLHCQQIIWLLNNQENLKTQSDEGGKY